MSSACSFGATPPGSDPRPDVIIAGAGIIGLSLALELHRRGARVMVLEAAQALQKSSTAAAGMLAVDDPHNPPALLPLSRLSAELYPGFLLRLEALSGRAVPFQTDTTIQYLEPGRSIQLAEHSLDPRQLAAALRAAVRATGMDLREHTALHGSTQDIHGITAVTAGGERFSAAHLVWATGAWGTGAATDPASQAPALSSRGMPGSFASFRAPVAPRFHAPVGPRKGQMLRVRLAPHQPPLLQVHRSQKIYVVPRLHGPQAGTALIGATVEDAGFDTTTQASDLAHLRALAAALLPALASEADAPAVEAWAGLRPVTPDHLPLLGSVASTGRSREFIATGHFRNGILLAPATAVTLADLLERGRASIDLSPFAPLRFAQQLV